MLPITIYQWETGFERQHQYSTAQRPDPQQLLSKYMWAEGQHGKQVGRRGLVK